MAFFSNKEIADIPFKGQDYILVLPGWYPHAQDPFTGDFNQRHVIAASLYTKQLVLYIGKDESGTLSSIQTSIQAVNPNLVEIRIIYPKLNIGFIDVLWSNLRFVWLLFTTTKQLFDVLGRPKLLHAYIVIRGGLAAALVGRKYNIPFVLSENWTIYYPNDKGFYKKRNPVFRWVVKKVFVATKLFLPVTENLNARVADLFGARPSRVVPNVVDVSLFNRSHRKAVQQSFTLLHASTMWYQKNPEGLLRSFKQLTLINPDVKLVLAGPAPQSVIDYADSLFNGQDSITFVGNLDYKGVADLMKQCDALVLFSRYENLPCVILEALCSGLPVISTNVGGIAEVIDSSNGILLENEDEAALLAAFQRMIEHYQDYNREQISANATSLYSYDAVGKRISDIYETVL